MIENLQTGLEKELTRNGESSGIQKGVFIWSFVFLVIALMALTTSITFKTSDAEAAEPEPCTIDEKRVRFEHCISELNGRKDDNLNWQFDNCAIKGSSCLRT